MILCEQCGKILLQEAIDKILADREAAIKRLNERNNNASKEKRSSKR